MGALRRAANCAAVYTPQLLGYLDYSGNLLIKVGVCMNNDAKDSIQEVFAETTPDNTQAEEITSITIGKYRSLKERYRFLQFAILFMVALFGFTVYANYDYWMFKFLIANNYILTDTLEEVYATHIREENRLSFRRDFDRVVISIVSDYLNDRYTYLYSPQEHVAVREMEVAIGRTTSVTSLSDDTVMLFVPNLSRVARDFVLDNRDVLAQYPNLVLDLRGNSGGWLVDFHRIAELFVPRGSVLSIEETRISLFSRTITSGVEPYFEFENIIILQNRRTASAAESLIMALQYHLPDVVTVGENTFGKGIGQVTIPLTRGYAVRATVLLVNGPDGSNIHITGIEPDIVTGPDEDPVDRALALIEGLRR